MTRKKPKLLAECETVADFYEKLMERKRASNSHGDRMQYMMDVAEVQSEMLMHILQRVKNIEKVLK